MNTLFESGSLTILENIARFGERRHEVLAGNVANISTPGYRMRDLPVGQFQQALEKVIMQRGQRSQGVDYKNVNVQTSQREYNPFPSQLFDAVDVQSVNLTFQDANNRSIEHQMMEMTKNKMMQAFAISLLQTQYQMLESAIREGR
ncbi:MAG: hypothetical protein IID46_00880 [Planctomycetes bacterium]|nr:hypothetical protein [Planctomycetota bacterium]